MKLARLALLIVIGGCATKQSAGVTEPQQPEIVPPPCADPAPLLGDFGGVAGFIVIYRDGTDGRQETDRLAAKYQFTPRFVFVHGTQGFSALLEPSTLASVRCEASVSFAEYNAGVTTVGL